MKRPFITLVIVVVVATWIRTGMESDELALELYRQSGEGQVTMLHRIDDKQSVEAYLVLWDSQNMPHHVDVPGYPHVAVYIRESGATNPHSGIWFLSQEEAVLQSLTDPEEIRLLNPKQRDDLIDLLQLDGVDFVE